MAAVQVCLQNFYLAIFRLEFMLSYVICDHYLYYEIQTTILTADCVVNSVLISA